MGLDFSEDACLDNVRALARNAGRLGRVSKSIWNRPPTRISACIVERVAGDYRMRTGGDQAYLFRSASDIERMNRLKIPVRLCESLSTNLCAAFPSKQDVDRNYVKLMKELLDAGTDPAIATHDRVFNLKPAATCAASAASVGKVRFQMLYGIRRDLQRAGRGWIRGPRLRAVRNGVVSYFMRRLAEQ